MAEFMGRVNFEYLPGATPLDPDESLGLIPKHITLMSQLNTWEQNNILEAEKWLVGKSFQLGKIVSIDFVCQLHRKMFENTWKWAGQFRKSDKNIGCHWLGISVTLKNLLDDVIFQTNQKIFPVEEIALRFHHRLVAIHLFENGNGRHARLMTDVFLLSQNKDRFFWGKTQDIISPGNVRKQYIDALRAADKGDHSFLKIFLKVK